MKPLVHYFRRTTVPLLAALLSLASFAHAGPTNSPAKSDKSAKPGNPGNLATNSSAAKATPVAAVPVEIPKSVFVIPTNQAAGKDPFFPRSPYPYGAPVIVGKVNTNTNAIVATVPDLVLNGLSGTLEKPLAIINNVTFGVGDNLDVFPGGKRMRVQCLEINLQTGTAVVLISGQRRALQMQPGK